jgi:ubiquitin fusion degradation protein 1
MFFHRDFLRATRQTRFEQSYNCYSIGFLGRATEIDAGDKIILPPSALDTLANMNVEYPLLFSITNPLSKIL